MWQKKWRHTIEYIMKDYCGVFNEEKQLWKHKELFLNFLGHNPVVRDASVRRTESFNLQDLKRYQSSFINFTLAFSNTLKCSV